LVPRAWVNDIVAGIKNLKLRDRLVKRIGQEVKKNAGTEMFPKLVEHKGEIPVIRDQLPTIFHLKGHTPGQVHEIVMDALNGYRATLPPALQSLLDRMSLAMRP
jgi:hypothetical protein